MSYSGSHTQFGHSDLNLLQNRVMIARLQELQKQQQHGQLGDVTTHLSRFGKQASGGQVPNFGGGMVVNSSDIFAPNNLNWMHPNLSSPTQGFSSNSYLHDQGLMANPSLQPPDVSLYGTPVASGRANIGHYSPLHANSLQKNMFLLDYSGMHGQPSGTGFLQEKRKHPSDPGGTAELDPLEEKILFDTENSGWDRSLSKLSALDDEEYANSSGATETVNPFSTVQSGSWSALMQSAVAEVSSSETRVQEELSGLCYQQTGLQSSLEQGLKKFSSDINIEQWSHLSQSLQNRQQSDQLVPSKHVRNDWQADVFRGSGSSVLSTSDTNPNIYGQIQHQASDDSPHKNGPIGFDAANKNAAQTFASQNNQGENSSDSYNSKVSHAYTTQPDHSCLNATDSESSARGSQKSPNQALCILSPGPDSQKECFSSIKSDNILHTNSGSAIKGKHNQSKDALSKCSPASNICATMDSKNTPEHNKGSLVSDHGGTTKFGSAVSQTERGPTQDVFSFRSSGFGDSVPPNFGNELKGHTWWMPSSLGQSIPALQGALAQNWSARSSNLGNSGFEISNLKSERLSHGSIFPGSLCATNQLGGKNMSDMSVPSEPISKRAEMSQQLSLSGSSRGSCLLENAGITGFQNYASGASRNTLPYISHLNQLGMSSQRDVMVDPSARNSEITINGEDQLDKIRFNEQKSSENRSSFLSKQYKGTKSPHIPSPFDATKVSSSGKAETFELSGRHAYVVDGDMSCILASRANQMVANQQVLASSTLPANADNMNLILSKSRKRKFSTYACLPWHVEVMEISWKLPDMSVAEQEWAKTTNRLVEERVNENDALEEMHPIGHGKKRLISTSQLMQQVFRPPPSSILRVDAASDYELLVYFVTKVALSDICKLISTPRIHTPHEHCGMLVNPSSNGYNSLIKDAQVLVERAMKLESQIEGLDGSLSTVDVRRECQELDKCSLINHFAKYHGRLAQSNATDTQSPFLQRYVSPTPVPEKLPEGMKCLSL